MRKNTEKERKKKKHTPLALKNCEASSQRGTLAHARSSRPILALSATEKTSTAQSTAMSASREVSLFWSMHRSIRGLHTWSTTENQSITAERARGRVNRKTKREIMNLTLQEHHVQLFVVLLQVTLDEDDGWKWRKGK